MTEEQIGTTETQFLRDKLADATLQLKRLQYNLMNVQEVLMSTCAKLEEDGFAFTQEELTEMQGGADGQSHDNN